MDAESLTGNVAWITKDGCIDVAKLPIDGILQEALDTDSRAFRAGLHLLAAMYGQGRKEAGVFLLGSSAEFVGGIGRELAIRGWIF